jgi:hypothetical protein
VGPGGGFAIETWDEWPANPDGIGAAAPWGYEFASAVRIGPNLYAYVQQNPWTKWDPEGLAWFAENYSDIPSATWKLITGFIPGVSQVESVETLSDPHASRGERFFAVLGLIPEAGGFVKGARAAAKAKKEVDALRKVEKLAQKSEQTVEASGKKAAQDAMKRGRENEKRVLKDIGQEKNNATHSTSHGDTIPDFENTRQVGDIKDTRVVANTKQMKAEREVASSTGREHVIVTGDNTKATKPLLDSSTRIIRRPDIGPQQ